jgi:hypothetical protein
MLSIFSLVYLVCRSSQTSQSFTNRQVSDAFIVPTMDGWMDGSRTPWRLPSHSLALALPENRLELAFDAGTMRKIALVMTPKPKAATWVYESSKVRAA